MANVAVIGTGYVGLTTGAILAHLGHNVVCADVVPEKVKSLSRGEVPILEDGLDELVREGLDGGRLSFVLGAAAAVEEADAEFIFLCVPTPQSDDGSADLSYIEEAAREIGPVVRPESVIINKSTVPVGSTLVVERALGRGNVAVVSNPEFLREGSAVYDALNPDRIVIGSEDQAAAIRVASLYTDVKAPVIVTDPASAETIKYASNAFLATKISFVNAVANLCEAVGADVRDVIVGMGYDRRIGFEFLKPGPGWGGSCFLGDETLIVARLGGHLQLMTFEELALDIAQHGIDDLYTLTWDPTESTPFMEKLGAFTARPYRGDVIDVQTKMGRRLTVTADHPFVVSDGLDALPTGVKEARDLTPEDWLPIAQHVPIYVDHQELRSALLDGREAAGIETSAVILRLSDASLAALRDRRHLIDPRRRSDVLRSATLRLDEAERIGIPLDGCTAGTATNGTYVPLEFPLDDRFWRMVGLYLAEGYIAADGQRRRLMWSFHPTEEMDLAADVAEYWSELGVKVTQWAGTTAWTVSISSRLLAGWFEHVLGVGADCYAKRIPDIVWAAPEWVKRELLRGLWDGDGSWSLVNGGPSVVFEYGTASRLLADGMLRLLGDLGIVASVRVGRTPKSTCDTFWIRISGADQLEDVSWLIPDDEWKRARSSIGRQSRRILPTGYRRLLKSAAWVRVTSAEPRSFEGVVYSVEVPGTHTVVTTGGLIAHNCFPKDSRALVRIAEDNGYDFSLLKGVIEVNDEQFERMASKIEKMIDGPLDGATVGVWGLTFKARTDDTRRSPSLEIIERLQRKGVKLKAYDPAASDTPKGVERVADAYAAGEGADVIAVLTEWDEFRWIDFEKLAGVMRAPKIVDCRNLLDAAAVRRKGFAFEGLGRP